ncbi:baculoviral IAP repeat-containing protein 7-A-like [Pomacea canaliculata]|uniref:baculoviral IAP repeat-containing protein 7-A-like n=1 Tax=Pomacea canaliculata TaxID=400727 RepID=UPI000D73B0FE|nr:baculoviral IAP repeat-containing protein 7-A-like [Pomacea canaliculata]
MNLQVAEIPGNEVVDSAHERQEPPLHLGNQLTPPTNRSSSARASRTSPTLLDNSNRTSPSYANNTIVSSSHSTGSAASSLLPNILDKMRDMGFPSDLVETALTEVELTDISEMDANTLVEKIVELQQRSESDSVHGEHDCRTDMQTDGDTSFLSEEINQIRRLREENARLKARRLCRTCKTSMVGMIFLPCGHVVSCSECGAKTRHCTLCNELIRATANVFLS